MGKNISDENIRVRAYYIWEESGKTLSDVSCWMQACAELLVSEKDAEPKKVKKTTAKKKPTEAKVPFYGVKKKK